MKKTLALALVALVVPSVALAAKPNPPGQSQTTHGNSQAASKSQAAKGASTVLYVLKGVITGLGTDSTAMFTVPGTGSDPTTNPAVQYSCDNGSVTIDVARVNHKRVFEALMAGTQPLTLTVCLDTTTKVIVKGSGRVDLANLATVSLDATNGNYGMVKVRYAKKFDPTDSTALKDFLVNGPAKQVIVKKPATPTS